MKFFICISHALWKRKGKCDPLWGKNFQDGYSFGHGRGGPWNFLWFRLFLPHKVLTLSGCRKVSHDLGICWQSNRLKLGFTGRCNGETKNSNRHICIIINLFEVWPSSILMDPKQLEPRRSLNETHVICQVPLSTLVCDDDKHLPPQTDRFLFLHKNGSGWRQVRIWFSLLW